MCCQLWNQVTFLIQANLSYVYSNNFINTTCFCSATQPDWNIISQLYHNLLQLFLQASFSFDNCSFDVHCYMCFLVSSSGADHHTGYGLPLLHNCWHVCLLWNCEVTFHVANVISSEMLQMEVLGTPLENLFRKVTAGAGLVLVTPPDAKSRIRVI